MENLAFVSLTLAGAIVSVSSGIPLITRKGRVAGAGVSIRTPLHGGAELVVDGPGLGPETPGWELMTEIRPHPAASSVIKQTVGDRYVDFPDLTSAEPFWVRDSRNGTHVLLALPERRLVRVSPVSQALRRGFWAGIKAAIEGEEAQSPSWGEVPWGWSDAGFYDRGVWLCLHPAPYSETSPVTWCYDGLTRVGFDWTGGRLAEAEAIMEEVLVGYAG